MKANVAVATVSGKAYYLITKELRKRNMPFLSLMPYEPIPVEVKVVITTEKEKHLIKHEKVLVYAEGEDPEIMISNALQIIQGKKCYERIVIGVDPGTIIGLAVVADGNVIGTENCFSVKETLQRIYNILKNVNTSVTSAFVKIGDGVPACKEELLLGLNSTLPLDIILESVGEAGTSRFLYEGKHRRGQRDMISAIKIAGRNGHEFKRGKT